MRFYAERTYLMGTFDIEIKDAQGNCCYKLVNQGKVGYNYGLYDVGGNKLANVKQHIAFSFKNRFDVDMDGKKVEIVFTHKLKINGEAYCKFTGLDLSTEGDIHHHDYSLKDDSGIVARVRLIDYEKPDMSDLIGTIKNAMNTPLEIDLRDDEDTPLVLALVFAIELAEKCDGSRYSG